MADFEKAIKLIFRHEGGYVNHPSDPGGETNLGVTDRLDGKVDGKIDINGDGTGDVKVKDLKIDEAKKIYKRVFWDRMQGDKIHSQAIAEILFDGHVNMGSKALKLMQEVLNIKVDGVFGDVTINAINNSNEKILFILFKQKRIDFYIRLVEMKPTMKVFLKGWLNRIRSFNI